MHSDGNIPLVAQRDKKRFPVVMRDILKAVEQDTEAE